MAWVKLDDQFIYNPKVIKAGKDARALYVTALCYSGGQLTDGRIDAALLPMLGALSEVDAVECAARLVSVGLWDKDEDDYQIHDYLDYNPTGDAIREKREAARERMRNLRASRSECSRDVRTNNTRSSQPVTLLPSPSPSPSPSPVVGAPTPPAALPASSAVSLWCEMIDREPTSRDRANLQDAIDIYGEKLLCFAIEEAHDHGANQWAYVEAILENHKGDTGPPGSPQDRENELPDTFFDSLTGETIVRRDNGRQSNGAVLSAPAEHRSRGSPTRGRPY